MEQKDKIKNDRFWKMIENWYDKRADNNGSYSKDYWWLKRTFLPSLEKAAKQKLSKEKRRILSDAYYVLGDLHFFNSAPKAAIKAYQKAIEIEPEYSYGSWLEIGDNYSNMGKFKEAIESYHKALEIYPDDDDSLDGLKCAKEDLEKLEKGEKIDLLYEEGDIYWNVRELMAEEKFDDAFNLIKDKKSLESMLYRARIFGALEDEAGYFKEWKTICKNTKKFAMMQPDWFYMPNSIYDNPVIWNLLLSVVARLKEDEGCYDWYDSLYGKYLTGKTLIEDSYLRRNLSFKYHYYRCKKDYNGLMKLHEKYPKWLEVKRELKKLQRQEGGQ